MKQICSNDHFKRLLKKFEKISERVVAENSDNSVIINFVDSKINPSKLNLLLNNYLLKNFKSNPFKTKSGVTYVLYMNQINRSDYYKFYVSYTFEDEFGNRSNQPKNIVFRIFIKSTFRKKRLVRWTVPITWEHLN